MNDTGDALSGFLQERFSLMENGPCYLMGFLPNGSLAHCNAYFLEKSGRGLEEALSTSLSELLSPMGALLIRESLPRAWEGSIVDLPPLLFSGPEDFSARGQLKSVVQDGTLLGAIAILYPSPVNDGKEARVEALFQSSPLGIAFCRLDGSITSINRALEDMLGYSLAELKSQSSHPLFPDNAARPEQSFLASLHNSVGIRQAPWQTILDKDGQSIPCKMYCESIRDEEGIPTEVMVVVEDTSQTHAAYKSLREIEERSNLLLEMAPIAIGIRDLETNLLVDANRALCQLFGADSKNLIGLHRSHYIHEEDGNAEAVLLQRLKNKEIDSYQMEKVYKSRNGHTVRGLMTRILIEIKGRQYAVAYVSDISEFKEQEMKLEAQNNRLMAINRELDRFLYSATHELRAPLTSIMGLIELIRSENPGGSIESLLALQERSIDKLDSYIRKIVSHSQNKRLGIKRDPINFEKFAEQITQELAQLDEGLDADISFEVQQEGSFFTDSSRLATAVMNVAVNALQFSASPKRKPSIHLRIHATPVRATIDIHDNGIGLAKDLHQKVFDMFFRASIRSKGSGLGLFISREMVEKLGGNIALDSVLDQGTTVFIDLPSMPPKSKQQNLSS